MDEQKDSNDSEGIVENVSVEELILAYLSLSKTECEYLWVENRLQEVMP
jgi:hypothetical protein